MSTFIGDPRAQAPDGHTGATNQPPLISPVNIIGAPASSAAGAGLLLQAYTQVMHQGFPTNWMDGLQLAGTILFGLSGLLMRA